MTCISTRSLTLPLTVSHWVGVGQAEAGQVDHAVGQVDVEAAHRRFQVTQLVEHHHAALHHWHGGGPRRPRGAAPIEEPVHAVFHRVLLGQVPQEGQFLQARHSLWGQDRRGPVLGKGGQEAVMELL